MIIKLIEKFVIARIERKIRNEGKEKVRAKEGRQGRKCMFLKLYNTKYMKVVPLNGFKKNHVENACYLNTVHEFYIFF